MFSLHAEVALLDLFHLVAAYTRTRVHHGKAAGETTFTPYDPAELVPRASGEAPAPAAPSATG